MHVTGLLLLGAALGVNAKLYKDVVKKNHTCAISMPHSLL